MDQKISFKTKLARKSKKYTNILKQKHNIDTSECATKSVAICNGGLTTGLSREKIMDILPEQLNTRLESIDFVENSSVTFLSCRDTNSAIQLKEFLNNYQLCDFFVLFVKEVPVISTKRDLEPPTGLVLIKNFVTEEEEKVWLESINWDAASDLDQGQTLKHRRVRHFGFQFEYGTNNVNPDKPLKEKIPESCRPVIDRMIDRKLISWTPDQLTVNQYEPGQGIPPHIDTHSAFKDPIISLSLESEVVMEFRRNEKLIPLVLPRRSLLLMCGESRYCWTHGITPRKSDVTNGPDGKLTLVERKRRTSFTFRSLLRKPCSCPFPLHCDSQNQISEEPLQLNCDKAASKLENLHVHQVYEEIANHFSETRHKPWPNVLTFVEAQSPGSIILDVGCGNGKYMGLNQKSFQIGCDMSQHLLKICRDRQFEVFVSNCLHVPFRDNSIDCCISIAVIHHLSTEDRRLKAISEMVRVLRPGGEALIYVWAKNQFKDQQKSSYLKQSNNKPSEGKPFAPSTPFSLPVHSNRTQFCHSDLLVPWKLKHKQQKTDDKEEEVYFRYYHMFDEGELELVCSRVTDVHIQRSFYDQGNWCVVLKKGASKF
ncbi:alkylated DNA repair protein alkB homolog 8 isoform X2 [Neocloeon triangulifer]|uniref:alkylated DNA repair protein alkB homolog 8 isoform X2 n=1 Tax=Neocloeon triangulifer TaxID=2078957 RepID=UPI00286F559D|nr:alkylated DNA repair protein alkB homolog 8 isoform X2 [Neocloeon triangulifer]